MYCRSLCPISTSNSDITTTTKSSSNITIATKTDSTISSKLSSAGLRCGDTDDVESSTTVCDHVHYKKGIIVDEVKSMRKCCEKTLNMIKDTHKQCSNKIKTTETQTKSINKTKLKNNKKCSSLSDATYMVEHKLKPNSAKSSVTYDIIFKPTSRCPKNNEDLVRFILLIHNI